MLSRRHAQSGEYEMTEKQIIVKKKKNVKIMRKR